MIDRLRTWARSLKREVVALSIAIHDPRTPWLAWAIGLVVVAYALSPIDLVPDFIPVLGYLDDLLLVPLGIWLVVRLIPADAWVEARRRAEGQDRPISRVGAVLVGLVWVGGAIGLGWLVWSHR